MYDNRNKKGWQKEEKNLIDKQNSRWNMWNEKKKEKKRKDQKRHRETKKRNSNAKSEGEKGWMFRNISVKKKKKRKVVQTRK